MRHARRLAVIAAGVGSTGLASCLPSYRMVPGIETDRRCPAVESLAWYLPAGEGDAERLERWCVTVGPEVVRERPTAGFPSMPAGGQLTVFSWNVAAGGGDLLAFLREEAGLRCDGGVSSPARGESPIVLLVQEAFRRSAAIPETTDDRVVPRAAVEEERPGERPDIVDVAARCGLALAYVAAARNGPAAPGDEREDRGVAVLSTLPLADVFFVELPFEAARRVAIGATLSDGSDARVRVVSAHLTSAVPPVRTVATGNGSRLRQSLGLVEALQQICDSAPAGGASASCEASVLLAGDLNTWSDHETSLLHLREWFVDSPPRLEEPTRGTFPTDHILFRTGPGAAPRLVDSSYMRLAGRYHSDHYPIRVTLRFPERAPE